MSSEGRVAIYLQDKHPLADGIRYVRHAEAQGFEAVWQAESRLVREATVPMAAFAATTERIKVGSGVVNNWTRNAGLMAATFVTLDDLAPGRIMLGIGAWWEPLATKVGVRRERPLLAMREYVEVVRRLIAMENVTFHGEFVDVEDIQIDIVHGDRSPRAVPIYLGATGMQMMELAGEIADGALLNYLVSPAYNATAMERLAAGAPSAACASRTSTVRSSWSARSTRIATWPWTGRASSSRSTWGSSRTSGRRAASSRRCWRRSARSSPGRPAPRRSAAP